MRAGLLFAVAVFLGCAGRSVKPASPPPPLPPFGLLAVDAVASSQQTSLLGGQQPFAQNQHTHVHAPALALDDAGLATAWCEGAPGPGVGEWISLRLPDRQPLGAIVVTPVVDEDVATFARITRLDITLDGRPALAVQERDGSFRAELGGAHVGRIDVRIGAVQDPRAAEACLADIALLGTSGARLRPVRFSAPGALRRLGPDLQDISSALAGCQPGFLDQRVRGWVPLANGSFQMVEDVVKHPDYFRSNCTHSPPSGLNLPLERSIAELEQDEPDRLRVPVAAPDDRRPPWELVWNGSRFVLDGAAMFERAKPPQSTRRELPVAPMFSPPLDPAVVYRLRMSGTSAASHGRLWTTGDGGVGLRVTTIRGAQLGGQTFAADGVYDLRVDAKGAAQVSSVPRELSTMLPTPDGGLVGASRCGDKAPCVRRLSADGAERSRFVAQASSRDDAFDDQVLNTPDDDLIVRGSVWSRLALAPRHVLSTEGRYNGFLARVDGKTGDVKWVRQVGSRESYFTALALLPGGDVIAAGNTMGPTSLVGKALPAGPAIAGRPTPRMFIARFAADGKLSWVVSGQDYSTNARGLAIDGDRVFVLYDRQMPLEVSEGGGYTVRIDMGLWALSAADGSTRWDRRVGAPDPSEKTTLFGAGDAKMVLDEGGQAHVAVSGRGPFLHGDVRFDADPHGMAIYVVSYSADGQPGAARRIVSPYGLQHEVSFTKVGKDLVVHGHQGNFIVNPKPTRPPYESFLLRFPADLPTGATLTVD